MLWPGYKTIPTGRLREHRENHYIYRKNILYFSLRILFPLFPAGYYKISDYPNGPNHFILYPGRKDPPKSNCREMCMYFNIKTEDLGRDAKIPLLVLGDSAEVFYEIALEMINTIKENNNRSKPTVYICPVGPVGQYPIFVRLVNQNRISLKNVWFINMDEYLNDDDSYIDISHKLSFRGFMEKNVYSKIDSSLVMPAAQRIFPDPQNTGHIQKTIDSLGGVDICFGGIGINGHLAFNEAEDVPAAEFRTRPARVLSIAAETRITNAAGDLGGAIDLMPERCVTVGMKEILSAGKIRLGVFREWHRAVVRKAAYGEITARFPASLLQEHPDVKIYVNNVAAQLP